MQGWGGCPRCRRPAQSERRRGPEAEAIAGFRAVGLEPLEPYVNVMTPRRSQCRNCGREVTPLLNNIRKGQGNCDLALPAYLGPQEMKQGGWTETVSAEDIDLALTIRHIRHLPEAPGQAETLTSHPAVGG